MAYETLVAAFDTPAHAAAAIEALKAGGFHEDDLSIFDKDRLSAGSKDVKEASLWHRLFGGIYTNTRRRYLGRPSIAAAPC